MFTHEFTALVVDDNPIARITLGAALKRQHFQCEYANDGEAALALIGQQKFDLVVTDLRMPKLNGHVLAVEILSRPNPPIVAVYTGVTDARLRNDLLVRGVDHIAYKPTDLDDLATQMKYRAIARKRFAQQQNQQPTNDSPPIVREVEPIAQRAVLPLQRINGGEYDQRLRTVNQLFPLSTTTNEVYQLSRCDSIPQEALAASVLKDAGLTAEILRIANSAFYLRTNTTTIDITEAITRLGCRKVGELALALHVSTALRSQVLPWFDTDLAQQRCVAASIAAGCVPNFCPEASTTDESTLAALLVPLDRLIMGTAFPAEYRTLLEFSKRTNQPLRELEEQVFPEDPTTALSRVLSNWGLSEAIWRPLRHVGETYEHISQLDEPLRTHVELLKLCVCLGESAVGRWLPWETPPSIPDHILDKYGLNPVSNPVSKIVEQIRSKIVQMQLPFRPNRRTHTETTLSPASSFADTTPHTSCKTDSQRSVASAY